MYDADDLRIFKGTVSGSSANKRMEYYLKDIAVYDMTTNTWTYYVSTNERIAKITPTLAQTPGDNVSNTSITLGLSQVSFYETDHLGNNRVVFSPRNFLANGDVIKTIHFAADYYPYGKTLRYFETSTFEEKYLTTQHERDRETGFDYRGARYYDSDLGRFLSLDPLAAQYPSWSDYMYVLGNPVMYIDPDGRESKETRWTKNHVLMNQAFGDGSGFNDLIEVDEEEGDNDCCGEVRDLWGQMKEKAEALAIEKADATNYQYANVLESYIVPSEHDFEGWDGLVEYLKTGGTINGYEYSYWTGKVQQPYIGGSEPGEILGGIGVVKGLTLFNKSRSFQKHHIIPNEIYRAFKSEFKAIGWKQNHILNLKKLPTPFHGNHPAYNKFIMNEIKALQKSGNLNIYSMKNLQQQMRLMIGDAYRSGGKLNQYFKP